MKVLFCGNIQQGNQEASILKALQDWGAEVSTVCFSDYFRLSLMNRVFNKLRLTKYPLYFNTRVLNERIVGKAMAARPDLILLFKPVLVSPRTVEKLARIARVFSWYPDYVPFPKTCSRFFMQSIPLYDCHFSFNALNTQELLRRGAKQSVFLPCAADLEWQNPAAMSSGEMARWGADIVFVGTFVDEERFWYLEKLCRDGYNLKVYGNSWGKCPKTSCLAQKGCIQFREVRCADMVKVFCASKIVLAFLHGRHKDTITCRSYEIPACGAFMLHQRTPLAEELFKEGEEAEFFSSYEELKRKIDYYLAHDQERNAVAAAGRSRVVSDNYTFMSRVKVILDTYQSLL